MNLKRPSTLRRRPGDGLRVALVGPCGSGKSTIAEALRARGIEARQPAQEHSDAPAMWQKLLHPDLLVALDAPNEVLRARRPGMDLHDAFLAQERRRLAHALAHAQLRFDTSKQSVAEIVGAVMAWLTGLDGK